MELHELVAVVPLPYYGRRQIAVSEGQLCPGVRLAARLRKALPDAVSLILEQQHLDRAAGRHPMAEQACGQHTGVVHDQAISWLQKLKQVVKCRCVTSPVFRSSVMSRDASRRSSGVCAISSSGRS